MPLVAAHVLYDPKSEGSPHTLFNKVKTLLKQTTKQDVEWLTLMRKKANNEL